MPFAQQARAALPFVDALASHGDRTALRDAHLVLTYRELDALVEGAADRFGRTRRLSVIVASNTFDAVIGYLAALRAGHVVLLASDARPGHLSALIERYDPDVLFAPSPDRPGKEWEVTERREGTAHELHPELALLLSTSGSTGAAKLVRLSYENLSSNARAIVEYLGIEPSDCAITSLPLQYCYGLSVLHSHLLAGASIALTNESVTVPAFWDLFRSAGATGLAGVPHTFELLERVGFTDMALPSLRYLTQAGGRMAPESVRRWATHAQQSGRDFVVMYGQTEATARMAYLAPAEALENPASIGRAIPGGELRIDDEELVYRGPNVMLGYAERPADLSLGRTVQELHTGDLARVDSAGRFEITGRRSRFVKVFGLRLDLDRVEQVLSDKGIHALATGMADTLVLAVCDPADEPSVRTIVKHEFGLSLGSVRVVVTPTLPRLANGKPDHQSVLALAAADAARTSPGRRVDTAYTDHGPLIREAFSEILGVPHVGGGDTFADLGGDSLSYVEMSLRLEEILGHLPVDWHTTPVSMLAGRAEVRRRSPNGSLWQRWRRWRQVEVTVPLRTLAILLIVGGHMRVWSWDGGAHVLMAAAGFSFARFQLQATRTSDRVRGMVVSLARIAVPAVLFIGAMAAFGLRWRPVNVVLLNDYLGSAAHPMSWELWFVEALVTLLALVALLFSSARIRALERAHSFAFAGVVLALGVAIRFTISAHDDWNPDASRPHSLLWLFALGWAAQRAARHWQRTALTIVLGLSVWNLFSDDYRNTLIFIGVSVLIWVKTVRIPALLVRPVGAVAGASLWIYLTHWQVFPPIVHHGASRPLTFPFVIAFGVAVWQVVRPATAYVERIVTGRLPRRRQDPEGDAVGELADLLVGADVAGAELRALR